jgi:alpha-1,6-rhamnosyltransferase
MMVEASRRNPGVSVVIPTHDMGHFLPSAVESVLRGSNPDVEVIVVDDGSTDDTQSRVRAFTDDARRTYDRRVTYLRQENAGKSAAVNRGLSVARGRRIAILDADDEFTTDGLRILSDLLDEEREADMAIGGFVVFDRSGTHGVRLPPMDTSASALRRSFCLRWRTPFSLNACLLDRSLIKRVGPLDVKLDRCMDIDYAIRCLGASRRVTAINEVVYRYRKHRKRVGDRVRIRIRTAQNRANVIWKSYTGTRRWVGVFVGLMLDTIKLVYELFAPY